VLDTVSDGTLVALVGLFGGVLLGLAARLGRFCTLGAIEDVLYGGSDLRARMWGIAIGTAISGTFTLSATGLFTPENSIYFANAWNPLANIAGGLLFGYGMALAGNCGYGALARLGGGDLRSFVIVLVMGISAYISLGGPLAGLRLTLFAEQSVTTPHQGIAHALGALSGLPIAPVGIAIGLLVIGLSLSSRSVRSSPKTVTWGIVVGMAIISGWAGTEWIAVRGFDATPVVSHTFSAPIGETILYVMTSRGNAIGFGTGSVLGVLVGAFLGSVIKGHFRWEACEDPRELGRQILGAALMGAVVAVGCSVGQGLSAFSVLAISAPLTLLSIVIGAAIGLRQLIVGFSRAA
jgi:uncharacterized membrane protein YedE/YeeE